MPKVGISIPWHQDSMYWPLEPLKVVSFWLALDDVNILNGGTYVKPYPKFFGFIKLFDYVSIRFFLWHISNVKIYITMI